MYDALQVGKPIEVNSDQMSTLTDNNQYYTTQEIAIILKIPTSIKLLVKNEKCVFYFTEKTYRLFGQPNVIFKGQSLRDRLHPPNVLYFKSNL